MQSTIRKYFQLAKTEESFDISNVLESWPYERGRITARRIRSRGGKSRLQLRLPIGLFQLETTGRPDGLTFGRSATALDQALHEIDSQAQPSNAVLDDASFSMLVEEYEQYYHRMLCYYVLEDFSAASSDAIHNQQIAELCLRRSSTQFQKHWAVGSLAYTMMMACKSRIGKQSLIDGDAIRLVESVVQQIVELKINSPNSGNLDSYILELQKWAKEPKSE